MKGGKTMKFEVTKTSDWDYKEQIEINSLEELMEFVTKNGCIIVTAKSKYVPMNSIEIYDDWRE